MKRDFAITDHDLDGCEILLASYHIEDYEGSAFVLFVKEGKLYEVNGTHCSCNGLEEQWVPEETSVEALRYRIEKGLLGQGEDKFSSELAEILDRCVGLYPVEYMGCA